MKETLDTRVTLVEGRVDSLEGRAVEDREDIHNNETKVNAIDSRQAVTNSRLAIVIGILGVIGTAVVAATVNHLLL